MSDSMELNGDESCMIYRIHYVGGSQDGAVMNAYHPYFVMCIDGEVYQSKEEPPDHEIWVDDFTRDIHLHYQGKE